MGVPLTPGQEHSPEQPRVEVVFTNLSCFQKRTLLKAIDDWLILIKESQDCEGTGDLHASVTPGTLPGAAAARNSQSPGEHGQGYGTRESPGTGQLLVKNANMESGSIMFLLPSPGDELVPDDGMAASSQPLASDREGGMFADVGAETSGMPTSGLGDANAGGFDDDVIMVCSSSSSEPQGPGTAQGDATDGMESSAQGNSELPDVTVTSKGSSANGMTTTKAARPRHPAVSQATPVDVELEAPPGVVPVSFSIDLPPCRGSNGGAGGRGDTKVTADIVTPASFNSVFEKQGDVPLYGRSWVLKKCTPPLPGAGGEQATGGSSVSILEGLKVLPPMAYVDTGAASASSPSPSSYTWAAVGASKQGGCFNCGSYGHQLGDCPRPRDADAIREAKERVQAGRETWSGGRYYESSSFSDLKPGQLSATLREALGIKDEGSPPPWAGRLRDLGYPPGYLVDNAIHQLPASGIEIIRGDDEGEADAAQGDPGRDRPLSWPRGAGSPAEEPLVVGDDGGHVAGVKRKEEEDGGGTEDGGVANGRPSKRCCFDGQDGPSKDDDTDQGGMAKEGGQPGRSKWMAFFPGLNAPFPEGYEDGWERATGISRHSIPRTLDAAASRPPNGAGGDANAPLAASSVAAAVAAAGMAMGGSARAPAGANLEAARDIARDGRAGERRPITPLGDGRASAVDEPRCLPVHRSHSSPVFSSREDNEIVMARQVYRSVVTVTQDGRHVERQVPAISPREGEARMGPGAPWDPGSLDQGLPLADCGQAGEDGRWAERPSMPRRSLPDYSGAGREGITHTPRTPHSPHMPHGLPPSPHGFQMTQPRGIPGRGEEGYWDGRDDRAREGRADGRSQGSPSWRQPSWEEWESASGSVHRLSPLTDRPSPLGGQGSLLPRESPQGRDGMAHRGDAYVSDPRARVSPWHASLPRGDEMQGTPQGGGPSPSWRNGLLRSRDSPFPNLPDGPAPCTPPLPRESPRYAEPSSQFRSPFPGLPQYPPPETPPPPAHSPGFELREHIHRIRTGRSGSGAANNAGHY